MNIYSPLDWVLKINYLPIWDEDEKHVWPVGHTGCVCAGIVKFERQLEILDSINTLTGMGSASLAAAAARVT